MNKLTLIHFILSSYAAQLQQYWNEIFFKLALHQRFLILIYDLIWSPNLIYNDINR